MTLDSCSQGPLPPRFTEVVAAYNLAVQRYDLYIFERSARGRTAVATDIVMTERDAGVMCRPSLQLTEEQGQALMDSLWSAGLRPAEGRGSAGALAATERHLEDLRQIVFSQNEIPKPEKTR